MGLWSWFFPTPEQRIARARGHLESGRFAEARDEIEGIEGPEAAAVRDEALAALTAKNLDAAVSWAEAGDDDRVRLHLELAEELHPGGLEGHFRDARKQIRAIRAARQEEEARRRAEEDARLLEVDPLGVMGKKSLMDAPPADDFDAPDAHERAARLALAVESYPDALKSGIERLGPIFGKAVLDLDDGRPDLALQSLLQLPDDEPLVCWERARAAYALGDPKAGSRELRNFARHAGQHHAIGREHTGELLARMLAESGDPHEAIRVLREVRVQQPKVGGPLLAQLLEGTGDLGGAEQVLRDLVRDHPKAPVLYLMLARVRLAGGHRVAAMQVLEKSLSIEVCGTPGRCGFVPPEPAAMRMLATLYLEDGVETERAVELGQQALAAVQQPTWDDLYLRGLMARATADPEAAQIAETLWTRTPADDERRGRLERHLPSESPRLPG